MSSLLSKYEKLIDEYNNQGGEVGGKRPTSPSGAQFAVTLYGTKYEGSKAVGTVCNVLRFTKNGGSREFTCRRSTHDGKPYFLHVSDMDNQFIKSLIDEDDAIDIFEDLVDIVLYDISKVSPFYGTMLDEIPWVETDNNHRCTTLAVGYDSKSETFTLYYNPQFILQGAMAQYMYAKKDYKSLEDAYIYMLKFYLIHEMSHITREHMKSNTNALKGVSGSDVNIYGDSYINQTISSEILKEKKSVKPVIGISETIIKGGYLGVKSDVFFGLKDFFRKLNCSVELGCDVPEIITLSANTKVQLIIDMEGFIEAIELNNSTTFIKAIDALVKKILSGTDDEKETSDDFDETSDEINESENNRQGEKEASENEMDQAGKQPDTNPEDNQGDPDSSDDSSDSGGFSDELPEEFPQEMPKGLDKLMDKAMRNSKEDLSKILGDDVLASLGKSPQGSGKAKWKKAFQKCVTRVTGVQEVWSNEATSARIEGEFGRDIEVPSIKEVVIVLDCSASMGPGKFKKVLNELPNMGVLFKDKPVIKVVYWGSNNKPYVKKMKFSKNLAKEIITHASEMGGNNFLDLCDFMQSHVKRAELVIQMTDAGFYNNPDLMRKGYRLFAKKTIWVLTPDYSKDILKSVDPTSSNRTVEL